MASLNRLSYFSAMSEDEDVDLEEGQCEGGKMDGRTPLDRTIDRIGMGWYQWTLLSLCGFGWLADNMWIQAIAIVLPRVQQHFSVRDSFIGTLSSSMFAGMMFGAVGWGTCSDLMGRTTAFNATLFLTSLFGVLASFASSFFWLCTSLFFLGSAVGGSMPTDGTLLLEHMPNGKQYLVTALSVFFSFGSVLAAVVGLLVIPGNSCPPAPAFCDVNTQNMGWKYLFSTLGIITLSMFLARILFFRLHESPRYLVHAGRPQEALESLQMISRFNGDELSLALDDVQDHIPAITTGAETAQDGQSCSLAKHGRFDVARETDVLVFDADTHDEDAETVQTSSEQSPIPSLSSRDGLRQTMSDLETKTYSSVGESNVPLDSHSFGAPAVLEETRCLSSHSTQSRPRSEDVKEDLSPRSSMSVSRATHTLPGDPSSFTRPRSRIREINNQRMSVTSSMYEVRPKIYWKLPRWLRKPLWAWLDRIGMVLSPEWMRTTLLVWAAWFAMSLAYTMFNVYLPKLLEGRSGSDPLAAPRSLQDSLKDIVIYALGGCPGAVLGAYLIDSPLGRRWSLAGSTFVTAFFCAVFVFVEQSWAVRASTVGISLSATAMWAVLYGWTPEIFGTKVRGSACGIASALSRIGGMIAPMLGGSLLSVNQSVPVYTSIAIFLLAGLCVLLLHEDEQERGSECVIVH
ncbi:MFS general substrate transporter [Laetiporus sulphureus 93-53]|uniref:MFS general substrate transporter n=1 Tax=Laetiporus sulphureus 93-53 TaxID=1314785 RepID=A0A165HMX5_9APHY|nr:MFS general substrate transporter [Laetiporus sulphureus 93-53]KZT11946.1 MFS general substrate transporter [Laetiporus sulphureus 93-53]